MTGWIDQTADGGRHWTILATHGAAAAATQGGLLFTSADDGWAYQPELLFTTDGGTSWQPERGAPALIGPVAAVGDSAWITGYACTNNTCPARLFETDRIGGRLEPLRHQPTTTADQIEQLLRPDASTAWALLGDTNGNQQLASTRDGGHTWRTRSLPCTRDGFGASISAPGADPLWLVCQDQPRSCGPHYFLSVVYQSVDAGISWARRTPTSARCDLALALDAATGTTAWATTGGVAGGSVLRTADGGRSWQQLLTGSDDRPLTPEAMTPEGPDGFSFVEWTYGARGITFSLDRTTDAGRTWHTTPLPAPASLTVR